jgi:antitoxin CptB
VEKNRLIWGSRRGMLELDLILLPFVENIYPTLEREDQLSYQRLLECEDQDLYAWFTCRQDPEDVSLQRIVERVRATTGYKKT